MGIVVLKRVYHAYQWHKKHFIIYMCYNLLLETNRKKKRLLLFVVGKMWYSGTHREGY